MADDVSLRQDNPYSNGFIFQYDDGDSLLERDNIDVPSSRTDKYYTVKAEDDLLTIAFWFYGSSKWYWVIKEANKIDNAFDISIGTTLLIPDLGKFKITSL